MSGILDRYRTLLAERDALDKALVSMENQAAEHRERVEDLVRVEQFFNVLADERRALLEEGVQKLVDYGVKFVFGPEYAFIVKSELAGKQVKTKFFVKYDGMELNLMDATGGGIADVVSFLLRVVMLILHKPAQRRVLILDEPFKFVSTSHFGNLTQFITELSESLNLQIIFVTHRPELVECATTVVKVSKEKGVSRAIIES